MNVVYYANRIYGEYQPGKPDAWEVPEGAYLFCDRKFWFIQNGGWQQIDKEEVPEATRLLALLGG